MFGCSAEEAFAVEQLYHLKQSTMSVQEYSLKFRTLAERVLMTTYIQGLEPGLRMQLLAYDDTYGLGNLIQLSILCSARNGSL